MGFLRSYRTGDNGFITIEWTIWDLLQAKLLAIIITIMVFGILTSLIPLVWLFFYFTPVTAHRKEYNIIGFLAGVYFLVDYHFGWMCWIILNELFGRYYDYLCYFNTGLLLTHLFLFVFESTMWNRLIKHNSEEITRRIFVICVFLMVFVGYFIGGSMVKSFVTKYKEPVKNVGNA